MDEARLALLPGLHLLQRGREEWQLGLDPSIARRIDRQPFDRGPLEPSLEDDRIAGLVVDRATLPPTRMAEADRAAVVQRGADRAAQRLAARARARVRLVGSLGVDPGPLLDAAGIETTTDPTGTAGAVLVMSVGEIDRDEIDQLIRHHDAHLLVRLVDGVGTIGPFVVPGQTACLRCVDAHLSRVDPLHPALVAQHARAQNGPADPHWPKPRDLALATMATAWAVRDVVTHAEGDRPISWSATVRLEAGLARISDVQWLRHPACGCSWE